MTGVNYAWIENGRVTNIVWLHPDNAGDFPNAAAMGDVPVQVGDTYENGVYYRKGERVLTEMEAAQKEAADMQEALKLLGVDADE